MFEVSLQARRAASQSGDKLLIISRNLRNNSSSEGCGLRDNDNKQIVNTHYNTINLKITGHQGINIAMH